MKSLRVIPFLKTTGICLLFTFVMAVLGELVPYLHARKFELFDIMFAVGFGIIILYRSAQEALQDKIEAEAQRDQPSFEGEDDDR